MNYEEITIETVEISPSKVFSKYLEYAVVSKARGYISRTVPNPLHDCQTFSIASIYSLLKLPKNQCLFLLQSLQIKVHKRQLLFNIPKIYEPCANEVFPKNSIIFKNEYLSTRASTMIFYLVNLDFLKLKYFDPIEFIKKEEVKEVSTKKVSTKENHIMGVTGAPIPF